MHETGDEIVEIEIDGYGDEGEVSVVRPAPGSGTHDPQLERIALAFADDVIRDVIEADFPGWEVNDGSHGRIAVLADGAVIEFGQRRMAPAAIESVGLRDHPRMPAGTARALGRLHSWMQLNAISGMEVAFHGRRGDGYAEIDDMDGPWPRPPDSDIAGTRFQDFVERLSTDVLDTLYPRWKDGAGSTGTILLTQDEAALRFAWRRPEIDYRIIPLLSGPGEPRAEHGP